jgi:hypothetical protein
LAPVQQYRFYVCIEKFYLCILFYIMCQPYFPQSSKSTSGLLDSDFLNWIELLLYISHKKLKIEILWDIAPYSLIGVDGRFRGAYCLHHQGDNNFVVERWKWKASFSLRIYTTWSYMFVSFRCLVVYNVFWHSGLHCLVITVDNNRYV